LFYKEATFFKREENMKKYTGLLVLILGMGCFGGYYYEDMTFYKSDSFGNDTDVTQVRLQGAACIRETTDEFGSDTKINVEELPIEYCIPLLVAQAVKEEFGSCAPQEFTLKQDQFGNDFDTTILKLDTDCLCYVEIRDEFGSDVKIFKKFSSLDTCGRFFSPTQFSRIRAIAEEVSRKYEH